MSDGVLVGKIVTLNADSLQCVVQTTHAGLDALYELPFMGEVVVMRASDWAHATTTLRTATQRIIDLEIERVGLHDDVERIGHERDLMIAANAQLQAQLGAMEDDLK